MKARRIMYAGEEWVSQNDLLAAMNDDGAMKKAMAMLKVSHEKGDTPEECVRRAVAYFYTELTGALSHEEAEPPSEAYWSPEDRRWER